MTPDLDHWLARPTLRIAHTRQTSADPDALWAAARSITVQDAALLGRLVRWRIPGVDGTVTFDALFRNTPFIVLEDSGRALVSISGRPAVTWLASGGGCGFWAAGPR